ncbi:hypothetical protein ACFPJ1_10335 [Kribbella qitaiheensis]|uniref:hypothetical protein n=1 Tax=Kribbella qitaiheensis TaxID=1544730 RepID=UPI00360C45AD
MAERTGMGEPGSVDDYAHLFEVRVRGLVEGWPEPRCSDGQEAWSVAGIHRIAARPMVGVPGDQY